MVAQMSRKKSTTKTHPFAALCLAAGWKHVELAERLHIGPSHMSRVLSGKSKGSRKLWTRFGEVQREKGVSTQGMFSAFLGAQKIVAPTSVDVDISLHRARQVLESGNHSAAFGLAINIDFFYAGLGLIGRTDS